MPKTKKETPCEVPKCECFNFRPRQYALMQCSECGHTIEFHKGAFAKEVKWERK